MDFASRVSTNVLGLKHERYRFERSATAVPLIGTL